MAEWVFNKNGHATIIFDSDCLRSNNGSVTAWISGENVYSLSGKHKGWFVDGVLSDSNNMVIGFLRDCRGLLPSRPGLGGCPGMPGFAGRPGRAGFCGVPGKPGRGGWSNEDLASYYGK